MFKLARLVCVLVGVLLAAPAWADTNSTISLAEYPAAKSAQESLSDLYTRLLVLKDKQAFVDAGFGPGFKEGNAWKREAISTRDKADDEKLPIQLQYAFWDLLDLGDLYLAIRHDPDALRNNEEALTALQAKVQEILDITIIP